MPAVSAQADGTATFRVADPDGRLAGVRLRPEVAVPGARLGSGRDSGRPDTGRDSGRPDTGRDSGRLDFWRDGGGWTLVIPRPPVRRMEYLLELRYPGGRAETVPDPGNPRRAPGAFGPKSVLEFPGYRAPRWLGEPAGAGREERFEVPAPTLGRAVEVRIWAPAGTGAAEPLPLLVVHDGPEYDVLARLTRYLAAGASGGWLPRLRAALLGPGERDRWYSADEDYATALAGAVLPALQRRVVTTTRIGMGTSLGALAMLHAHVRYPDVFGALFLQSGSFFSPRFDAHEIRFGCYERIAAFTAAAPGQARPVPVTLTCGSAEENVHNNRLMAAALRAAGYPAALHEVPDAHNYTAWRDAFDPALTGLLRQVAGG